VRNESTTTTLGVDASTLLDDGIEDRAEVLVQDDLAKVDEADRSV
jgi:hypothetical protein